MNINYIKGKQDFIFELQKLSEQISMVIWDFPKHDEIREKLETINDEIEERISDETRWLNAEIKKYLKTEKI